MLHELFRKSSADEQERSGTSFSVDDVRSADKPIWTHSLAESVTHRFRRKILALPERNKAVVNAGIDSFGASKIESRPEKERARILNVTASRCHPLIDAVGTAFGQHRPLRLSPDSIWLTIAQGFSHHISENAESLRHRMVRHEGRSQLTASVNDLTLSSFEGAISEFSSQIRRASDPVLHETLVCDFSTTTQPIRTASEVVLMDSYSSYFQYDMRCICGIPRIAITGSLVDWERIRARIEVLGTFDLEWWVGRLRPILDEFIQTVKGRPAAEFWQAIYKPKKAYGVSSVTGWIADLFPYLGDAPARRRNHIFEHKRENWAVPVDKGVQTHPTVSEAGAEKGVGTNSFPSGLSSVPVKVTFMDDSTCMLDLVGGFLAVEQAEDLALSPVISWCVTQPAPKTPVVI
ncbi:MAG: DUF4419 domain-containing protein [Acidobacteriaceae bacterium]|nr:DUF4419 domain-containing protein [Acidobacteriaceae bacterium]